MILDRFFLLTDQILVPSFFLYITNRIESNFSPRLILYRSKNLEKLTDIRVKLAKKQRCPSVFAEFPRSAARRKERRWNARVCVCVPRNRKRERGWGMREGRARTRREGGEGRPCPWHCRSIRIARAVQNGAGGDLTVRVSLAHRPTRGGHQFPLFPSSRRFSSTFLLSPLLSSEGIGHVSIRFEMNFWFVNIY